MQRVCIATGIMLAGAALLSMLTRRRSASKPVKLSGRLLVIHGLNMDKRGYVEVEKWGTTTLAQYNEQILAWAAKVRPLVRRWPPRAAVGCRVGPCPLRLPAHTRTPFMR